MTTEATTTNGGTPTRRLDRAVIRFAGDSGDGMQLTGNQFTAATAAVGNDLATLPDFPAEIRAPAGTLAGVSGFQIQFASEAVYTPGDAPDVLVAMNPAALRANVKDLPNNGIVIVNLDAFKETDLKKAGYTTNPLEDGSLDGYRVFRVELTRLTRAALEDIGLPTQSVDRCKNFFALGMTFYLFGRPLEVSLEWIEKKFASKPQLVEANQRALRAGQAYCEATEVFAEKYEIPAAPLEPGTYRNISGNQALALGLVAASQKSGRPILQGSYPITPASDLLHLLANYKNFGVVTFQAEDEIAAVGAAIGGSFAGSLGVTSTSGPGMALKSEFLSLAIMAELPLIMIDIQRAGPSTGLPTKTEQSDLALALHGRFGESPCIVLAASSPADCFEVAYEACQLSIRHMTPVIVLSDGFVANGTEPWRLPDVDNLPEIPVSFRSDPEDFMPYGRDPETLAREWAIPGTPGLEHRIGGLEKDESGNVSYDSDNHERMVLLRAEKVARVADSLPDAVVDGPDGGDGLLIVGWGSTFGAITSAVHRVRAAGREVSHVHLRHLNPLPKNLGEILKRYDKVLVPEINCGQLADLLKARFVFPVIPFNHVRGLPFKAGDLEARVLELMEGSK
ncbi:MAG: 2-oxoacid:acceptor oxidoreductase subunit alpha [Acidobacteriota bacterium]|nr:2-oxoacid:acceptor oxidoreductase subunit alpha [Acidobacteriota bacterium]MDH3784758.1 2-oxoacid:acceptor oxidoreductase subunit alpha [Acidobacteriota bacterium]